MSEPARRPPAPERSDPPPRGERRRLFPVVSKGRYFFGRLPVAVVLILLYLGLPHFRVAHKPAFLIDLSARQLHLGGTTFFATETLFLVFFGIALVVFIALFTALFGRVWCGWACPQPIYLEFVFRPIEALFGGPALRRRRRASQPLDSTRALRAVGKYAAYVVVAAILAHTFVAYFVGTDELAEMIRRSPRESWAAFVTMLVVTGMILIDFAYFREQTCIIACPYGRLQSLLIDARSWIVGYDHVRGEPRRRLAARAKSPQPAGDCIDCSSCVRTCPTGIDIRDGLQLECIGCTQCIDACDAIMDRRQRPRGLIRYTSLDGLQGKPAGFWRPRVIVYGMIVVAAVAALVGLASTRQPFEVELVRVTGAPYYVQSDGQVCNRVRLRLTNRSDQRQRFSAQLLEPRDASFVSGELPTELVPLAVRSVATLICEDRASFQGGRRAARILVESSTGSPQERTFWLLGPVRGAR
jgi:cytochrome c oxidase accessory protein FixG